MTPTTVPYETRKRWFQDFPLDANGLPTSDAAFNLISHLFHHRHRARHVDTIAAELDLNPELVWIMCRHLELIELVLQVPPGSKQFRYDVRSANTQAQVKVESALLDYPATNRSRPWTVRLE